MITWEKLILNQLDLEINKMNTNPDKNKALDELKVRNGKVLTLIQIIINAKNNQLLSNTNTTKREILNLLQKINNEDIKKNTTDIANKNL